MSYGAYADLAADNLMRAVRRARMLAQVDKTAPQRDPRPSLWAEQQAWAGWSG